VSWIGGFPRPPMKGQQKRFSKKMKVLSFFDSSFNQ